MFRTNVLNGGTQTCVPTRGGETDVIMYYYLLVWGWLVEGWLLALSKCILRLGEKYVE